MAMYLGDFAEDTTVRFLWDSSDGEGASITRATDGTISVYKDGGTTQSTAGVTDTEDFDSLTGIHLAAIDTSADAFYATGSDYAVVLSAATIDGQTVNAVLAHFSIENRFDEVDATKISGDATAADNLELDYDGTGYAKTNSTIGTATAVTNIVTANATQISGDSTAADNLELDYDGTGYAKTNSTVGTVTAITNKVTPIDVDGVTFAQYSEIVLSVLSGVATPSGSDVAFKQRDGSTTSITITYGSTDGQRTASVIT